jgi:arsenate reductase
MMKLCRIEVLVFDGCPHAKLALELAQAVAARLSPDARVSKVVIESEEMAARTHFYGSPTILVNGEDVEGCTGPSLGLSCRVYDGSEGVPPEWMVEAAVLRALEPRHILFLCVANSARSQMAEGLARSMVHEGLVVSSAGSEPSRVRPEAITVLSELGIDISTHTSKAVSDLDTSTVDTVITLCAEEVCPLYLGKAHRLHWAVPDPAAVKKNEALRLQAFRKTRDELRRRLEVLLRTLF